MPVITTEQEIARLTALTNELKNKLKAEKAAEKERVVVFTSKQELAEALSNGRTFDTPNSMSLWYDDTVKGSPYVASIKGAGKDNESPMHSSWDSFNKLLETTPIPVPWYMSTSEFYVQCYVSDTYDNPGPGNDVDAIIRYSPSYELPFRGRACNWQYATPTGK
jgi:hypothetical protein